MGCGGSKAAAPAAKIEAKAAPDAPKSSPDAAPAVAAKWRVKLGAVMPDFPCVTTQGNFTFHEFLSKDPAKPFTILFSHPKDFTPVCTTELGVCHTLAPEFEKRGIKMIGISCDPVETHTEWQKDILAFQNKPADEVFSFPMISDPNKELITTLGMIDPEEKDAAGLPLPARALILIGADRTVKYSILYPATTGRDFNEVLRAIDSVQLTAVHSLATPVNWKQGERCIVAPVVATDAAKEKFKNFDQEELPSGKPYLRTVDCPEGEVKVPEVKDLPKAEAEATAAEWWIKLGSEVPDFECDTTVGKLKFHEFLATKPELPYTVLFTHPKDFTPVCTTELGMCEQLVPEFEKRGCKMLGLSCDSVDEHMAWSKDILAREKLSKDGLSFPLVADSDRSLASKLGMIDPAEKDGAGIPLPARALVLIGADKKVKLSILYPATTGRNFAEVLRTIDSVILTAQYSLATPVNWKAGERCVVAPVVPTEDAQAKFKNFKVEELPSGKPYLRTVDCPVPEEKAGAPPAEEEKPKPDVVDEVPPIVSEEPAAGQKDQAPPVDVEVPVVPPAGGGGMFACCSAP